MQYSRDDLTVTTLMSKLRERNFNPHFCESASSACSLALSLIPSGSSIGWGGSCTLTEAGIINTLYKNDYILLDRNTVNTPDEKEAMYYKHNTVDYYLMSTNAITNLGELINIDGNGNRVSSLIFGPKHVILFVGMNKLVSSIENGIDRIKSVACPMNAKRLMLHTPCSITGACSDCHSNDCMCANTVITRFSRSKDRITVILINEELGY